MILAGLWCSNKKPPMQQFLEPIIDELRVLEDIGKIERKFMLTSTLIQ